MGRPFHWLLFNKVSIVSSFWRGGRGCRKPIPGSAGDPTSIPQKERVVINFLKVYGGIGEEWKMGFHGYILRTMAVKLLTVFMMVLVSFYSFEVFFVHLILTLVLIRKMDILVACRNEPFSC